MFSLVMSSSHSFDTVDRAVLDLVLGRAGLPVWFPKACFGYHADVRLRFELSCDLGEPWTLDGSLVWDVPSAWSSLWPFVCAGASFLSLSLVSNRSFVLTISSVTSPSAAVLSAAGFTNRVTLQYLHTDFTNMNSRRTPFWEVIVQLFLSGMVLLLTQCLVLPPVCPAG